MTGHTAPEMTGKIYANSMDFHEEIYANGIPEAEVTRSHEGYKTSGCSTAEVRCFRLCVVLLVVLMTAITVLGIKLVTERNLNKKLEQERDQSLKHSEQLMQERDEAWKKLNASDIQVQLRWKHFNSSFYYFSDMKNWTESRQDCIERGADLVIINREEKRDFIEQHLQGSRKWIGLTDRETEGQWKWVDGTKPIYNDWGHDQPDNYNNEDCVEIGFPASLTWNDRPCSERQGWICEKIGGV